MMKKNNCQDCPLLEVARRFLAKKATISELRTAVRKCEGK